MKRGIDVSEWNGNVDWAKVKASGLDFAIIRAGFGNDIKSQDDEEFFNNVKECESKKFPYGIYFYMHALNDDMVDSEVAHTLRLLKNCGKYCVYGVWLDVEDQSLKGTNVLRHTMRYIERIKKAGWACGVYTGFNFMDDELAKLPANIPVWFAQYHNICQYKGGNLEMWQYSDLGSVPGVSTRVDTNICYTDKYDNLVPERIQTVYAKEWISRKDEKICDVALKTKVPVEYQVHVLNGKWLPMVNKADIGNPNGYAGNGKPIDAIRVISKDLNYRAYYRVKTWRDKAWKPMQIDASTSSDMKGYAGIFGYAVIDVEVVLKPRISAEVRPSTTK